MLKKGSAAKRQRQSENRRVKNRMVRTQVRNAIKQFRISVEEKNAEEAGSILKTITKLVDSAQSKGVYHKNKVARTKSRLTKHYNHLVGANS